MTKLTCFKAYDIRGKLGDELNADIAYRIGRAYGEYLKPKKVAVGRRRSRHIWRAQARPDSRPDRNDPARQTQ
jgi:hypothetical protein